MCVSADLSLYIIRRVRANGNDDGGGPYLPMLSAVCASSEESGLMVMTHISLCSGLAVRHLKNQG